MWKEEIIAKYNRGHTKRTPSSKLNYRFDHECISQCLHLPWKDMIGLNNAAAYEIK